MPPVDDDGKLRYQQIRPRIPQAITPPSTTPQTPSSVPSTITNANPPDPSSRTMPAHDNSRAVRTIIEYFFLIMALFIASLVIFRRLVYLRQSRRGPFNHGRAAGPPRVHLQGSPSYFLALPLPAAYADTRRTRANDIDFDGRRFTSAGADVDHDGLLRDKDLLPKYESLGGPPKYTDLELQQELVPGNVTPPAPVLPPPPPAARSPRNSSVPAETPTNQTSRDENSR